MSPLKYRNKLDAMLLKTKWQKYCRKFVKIGAKEG